jgi:ligand-binding sensor domain-containing protein/anti-sigma regulatory factor (Ser/Thr protein kinase)
VKSSTITVRSVVFLLALAAGVPVHVYGQFTHSTRIDQRSGLSDTRVRVIEKDCYGFVWIGTHLGLNRFDGSQVRRFRHETNNLNSLMDDEIYTMVLDSQRLWVGGQFGVSSLDLTDYSMVNIQFSCDSLFSEVNIESQDRPIVTYLHLDGDILWISTRECGLLRFDIASHQLRRFSFAEHREEVPTMASAKSLDQVMGFCVDVQQDSIFWIGTGSGLIRFNNVTYTHQLFYTEHEDRLYQDAVNTFRRIVQQDDGLIYYLCWNVGVNVFNPHNAAFYPLPLGADASQYLRHSVYDVRRHDPYSLWLRTKEGLYMYNTSLRRTTAFYPNERPEEEFSAVYFQDEAKRRWFATREAVHIYDPLLEQFLVFSYDELNTPEWAGFARKVVAHPDGNVVTILGQIVDGLYHFSHRENKWFETPIPGIEDYPGGAFIGVDLEAHEQYGWVFSGASGIYAFDSKRFEVNEINLNISLEREVFADLEWGANGVLWIGTRHEGLLRYNPQTKQTRQYVKEIFGDGLSTGRRAAVQLFADSRGNIWFTTDAGHSVYRQDTDTFINFKFSEDPGRTTNHIARFIELPGGEIWCVSRYGILSRGSVDHPEEGLKALYSVFQKADLTPTYVEGLVADESGQLFILSETALIRVDTAREVSSFSFEYAEFLSDSYCFDHLSESSFVVGMRNRFAVVNMQGLKRNTEIPYAYLTEVTVNEKPVRGNFILERPDLDLKHNENFVSFSFSAISYTLPEGNLFQYRLTGFDPDWINAGDRRFANYTNIPSGDYIFELQVANNEGNWNTEVYTVPMTIASPWWATWWFRILALCALVTAGVLAYRFRIAQIRKEARLKTEFDRKIGDVELSALRAQMNPHFIFNCLNSIENYILKNESVKAAEYINDFARLIRLILQNSRSEYVPLKDEVEAIELYLQMESLRFDDKFSYRIDVSSGVETTEIDVPPMLIQPFIENAIWHGLIPKKAPGKITVEISQVNGELICTIEDDGIGREKSREVNASMLKRGKKSMGMLITKNRIDVFNELYHTNATVQIMDLKDEKGNALGTRVELNIPIE